MLTKVPWYSTYDIFGDRLTNISSAPVEEVETNAELMQVPVLKGLLFETFRYRANPNISHLFMPINYKRRKGGFFSESFHFVSYEKN